jgi:hypothetical protein
MRSYNLDSLQFPNPGLYHMDSYERLNTRMKITVAGGGAAGIFAAISCKEKNSSADITVLEQGDKPLVKVALSGGEDAISQFNYRPGTTLHILPQRQQRAYRSVPTLQFCRYCQLVSVTWCLS